MLWPHQSSQPQSLRGLRGQVCRLGDIREEFLSRPSRNGVCLPSLGVFVIYIHYFGFQLQKDVFVALVLKILMMQKTRMHVRTQHSFNTINNNHCKQTTLMVGIQAYIFFAMILYPNYFNDDK